MPRTKTTRDNLGSVQPIEVVVNGRKVTRYDARKRYTRADGTRGQKFKRCRTSTEARTALKNFETEIQNELAGVTGPEIHTFFELCDYYETEYIKPAVFVGDKQLGGYRQDLEPLRVYVKSYRSHFGDPDVTKITYEHVRKYAEYLAVTPVRIGNGKTYRLPKPASLNRKLSYLRRIFNIAIQLGWLDKNPFKLGKRLIDPNAEEPSDRALTMDEEERLLAACTGPDVYFIKWKGRKEVRVERDPNPRAHLKPVIIFAIETGMRKKEMFTTRRPQLNFDKHIIELNARQTKALKKRYIPMSDRLEAALKEMLKARPFGKDDLIFDGLKDCDTAFATACKRAGIEGLTFHGLRHTAATYMDEAGISTAARHNSIGHSSSRISQRYVNPTDDVLDSSRVKMNEFRTKLDERRQREKDEQEAAA